MYSCNVTVVRQVLGLRRIWRRRHRQPSLPARFGTTPVMARKMRLALLPAVAALALTVGPVAAQPDVPDAGGRVYGLIGPGFGDGRFVATGAGAGLRLTRHLGLDVELTHLSGRGSAGMAAPWFSGAVSGAFPLPGAGDDRLLPTIRFEHHGRDVTTFLTKFTVEFPIAHGLLFPYLTGGGGLGRVTERSSIIVDPIPSVSWRDRTGGPAAGSAVDGVSHFGDTGVFLGPPAYSELGLAMVLGGGVDVRLWRGLGGGVDIRWLRVLRSYDALDTAQVTARVSYRF